MRALLAIQADAMTPIELIRILLQVDVDLLWFGGIGTYVRASSETDLDAGDRNNDPLRVTAAQVLARVIGEGANLGMTQRARIEFAGRGGRINTDFHRQFRRREHLRPGGQHQDRARTGREGGPPR
ncbi:MAG: NAD-glutamate dehydrogenase [Rhodospirillaceae bacterium]|nr:NAD-glutamate dehydrogenase [Rhodospirillaceae bacterium]